MENDEGEWLECEEKPKPKKPIVEKRVPKKPLGEKNQSKGPKFDGEFKPKKPYQPKENAKNKPETKQAKEEVKPEEKQKPLEEEDPQPALLENKEKEIPEVKPKSKAKPTKTRENKEAKEKKKPIKKAKVEYVAKAVEATVKEETAPKTEQIQGLVEPPLEYEKIKDKIEKTTPKKGKKDSPLKIAQHPQNEPLKSEIKASKEPDNFKAQKTTATKNTGSEYNDDKASNISMNGTEFKSVTGFLGSEFNGVNGFSGYGEYTLGMVNLPNGNKFPILLPTVYSL